MLAVVVLEESSARHARAVHHQAGAIRRHEAHVDIKRSAVAVLKRNGEMQPDIADRNRNGPDAGGDRHSGFDDQVRRMGVVGRRAKRKAQFFDRNRAEPKIGALRERKARSSAE